MPQPNAAQLSTAHRETIDAAGWGYVAIAAIRLGQERDAYTYTILAVRAGARALGQLDGTGICSGAGH
jgi:hypothetical protein